MTPLIGTYIAPELTVGRLVKCLYRQGWRRVIRYTVAPIPWPVVVSRKGGGQGLLVNKTLARAIRKESAAAIMHHFGVGSHAVWKWRQRFGVGKFATAGSRKLHLRASVMGGAKIRNRVFTDEERAARSKQAKQAGRRVPPRWTEQNGGWTATEVKLLATMNDAEVAEKTGRSIDAVRAKRNRTT